MISYASCYFDSLFQCTYASTWLAATSGATDGPDEDRAHVHSLKFTIQLVADNAGGLRAHMRMRPNDDCITPTLFSTEIMNSISMKCPMLTNTYVAAHDTQTNTMATRR